MKKNQIIGPALLLLSLLAGACGGGQKQQQVKLTEMTFGTVQRDTVLPLATDGTGPRAEIRLLIHYATGQNSAHVNEQLLHSGILSPDYFASMHTDGNMEHAVDSFIHRYLADYRRDYGELFRKDQEHHASYNLDYTCETRVADGRKGIVCYMAEVYWYGGGAHGMQYTLARNIRARDGKVLQIDDVFVPGYDEDLKDRIVEALCRRYDVRNLSELQARGIFMEMEPYVTDNFMMGAEKVSFVYCDTEIAPHAEGQITAEIPYSDLKDLMK